MEEESEVEEEEEESEEEYESEVEPHFPNDSAEVHDKSPIKKKSSRRSNQKSSSRKLGKSEGATNLNEETKDSGWAQMNQSIREATDGLDQSASQLKVDRQISPN